MATTLHISLILVLFALTGSYVIGSDVSSAVTPQTHNDITDHSLAVHDSGTSHDTHLERGGGHNGSDEHGNGTEHHKEHGVHVAAWNFAYVSQYLIMCLFILAVGLLKILFHKAECLTNYIPESCVLIVFGTTVGAILQYGISPNIDNSLISVDDLALEPKMFMLILLPPVVLDSAYSLNDKVFADNIGTILLYAVVGTILNWFMIGPLIYGLSYSGVLGEITITFVQCLLFASFIVAVDPVAVLAIFQEVGVNNVLYFLVFGESLLNDAVTVVLYNMMKAFNDMTVIPVVQMLLGLASFFTVSLGGLSIGILFGVLTALLTRTTHNCRIVEPLVLLVMAYLSYICAELFHWSGIISMIGCGILQAQYAFTNIAEKSLTTVNYFVKMLSSLSDAVIFLFLGLEVIRTQFKWHTGFIISALLIILICRLITVFGLTWLCNRHGRVKMISLEEQFIMWYGGLRGAVCFALCATIDDKFVHKNLFLTATLVIVFFTVFVQGITIKPLVSLLKISRKHGDESHSLAVEFQSNVSVHVTAGVECIIGNQGGNDFKDWMYLLHNKYLRYWLQNSPMSKEEQFLEMYQKIAIRDHVSHIYEATSRVVKVNDYDDDECSQEDRPLLRPEQLFSLSDDNREFPMMLMEEDDMMDQRKKTPDKKLGMDELMGIMGASYNQNFSKGVDREIGGNKMDMILRLKQKHQRLVENKRLRSPAPSPHGSMTLRRRTVSGGNGNEEIEQNHGGDNQQRRSSSGKSSKHHAICHIEPEHDE